MDKQTLIILSMLIPLVIIFVLIAVGWRNKLRRQAALPGLPTVPATLGEPTLIVDGQYVTTTASGDWLERIAVHSLGLRTKAQLGIHPEGLLLRRDGAPDLFIATTALTEITTSGGMAGKFVEKDGIIVIGWLLDTLPVDTGFRTTEATAKRPLIATLKTLLPVGSLTTFPDAAPSRKNTQND